MGSHPSVLWSFKPHFLMTLSYLGLALFLVLLRSVVASGGVSGKVIVVYEHFVSSVLLLTSAFFLERGRRPDFSFPVLCWSFFIGLLQAVLGQLMMTLSLRYVTASFQSVALNLIPAVVFILAVASGRELFDLCGKRGQAKVWGILVSTAGATVMVFSSAGGSLGLGSVRLLGCLMLGVGVLASSGANVLVEYVSEKYPAQITLSAVMNLSGAVQLLVVGAATENDLSSWEIKTGRELFVILYGGTVVTGFMFYATNWCIHKKGPVFTMAFSPLLIVFSFILEALLARSQVNPWSVTGAALVIGGLYLLLWGKAGEQKFKLMAAGPANISVESSLAAPLLPDTAPVLPKSNMCAI